MPITDFSAYSHDALLRMLMAGDVGSVRSAADSWRQVGRSLAERGDAVQMELLRFSPQWRGGAADQYKIMMAEFVEGVDGVAELVASVRDGIYSASDALARAQQEMPAAVAVPALSDVASVVGGGPSSAAMAAWQRLSDDQQVAVADQLRQHRASSDAAGGAASRAVAIMSELAGHYLEVAYAMPTLPVAAEPPPVPTDTATATVVATSLDTTGAPLLTANGVVPTAVDADESPLFGDMYAAGTLAASAAVLGRFRLGSSWLDKRRQDKAAAETPLPDSAATGGGAGGGSGAGVIGAAAVEPPEANPVLAGGVIGAGVATAAPGLVAPGSFSATGAGGTGTGMGMMPPMMPPPMMGGGGGEGMGRRIPPWLVETEPVFGESVPVTPAVIGADAEDLRPRRPMV